MGIGGCDERTRQRAQARGKLPLGAVKFEIERDATSGMRCNCSVCTKVGLLWAWRSPRAFGSLAGERDLSF